MTLRNDVIRVEESKEATWSKWWFKVPVANHWGGLWCLIQMPENQSNLLKECELRETKLIWKGDHWTLHILVRKEVPEPLPNPSQPILAVDPGEVRPATAVLLKDGQMTAFFLADRNVREIRMHYNWLGRVLGKNKCLDTNRKIGRAERRKVDAELQRLSKDVVELARENNAVIAIGDLTGIREKTKNRGKMFRAKIARMPSYRLSQFIEQKAQWAGVPVVKINEARTSKTCHACGAIGRRPHQGLFVCDECGLQYNADLNGAINIGRRFLDQVFKDSGALYTPLDFGDVMPWPG